MLLFWKAPIKNHKPHTELASQDDDVVNRIVILAIFILFILVYSIVGNKKGFWMLPHDFASSLPAFDLHSCNFQIYKMWSIALWDS